MRRVGPAQRCIVLVTLCLVLACAGTRGGVPVGRPGCHVVKGSGGFVSEAATNVRRKGSGYMIDVYDRSVLDLGDSVHLPVTVYVSNITFVYLNAGRVGRWGCPPDVAVRAHFATTDSGDGRGHARDSDQVDAPNERDPFRLLHKQGQLDSLDTGR